MTAHIAKPFIHVEDANGNPYVSAKLYVYDVGTTNLKSIYSNAALSVSITNPMTSDAAGNFARAYVASGTYKLRAETSAAALIWEVDNIDTGLTSGSGALAITAGGTGSTTAAAARTALGAASQTSVDDLAADVLALSSTVQSSVSEPQGRLTPLSTSPVIATDVVSGAAVYYTPYVGAQIPIYDGTQFLLSTFTELTLTLNAAHLANQIYDVFVWLESGVVTMGTGPAWTTATAGAGVRGSGAGTSEIHRVNGIWTNSNAMTMRNGATTYSVAGNLATYVGSLLMYTANGTITCHTGFGQSRIWSVWNAYNRKPITLIMGDATASWAYSTATTRQSNGAAGNTVAVFTGLAEEVVDIEFSQTVQLVNNGSGYVIGIGVNSTTVTSSKIGQGSQTDAGTNQYEATARHIIGPIIGLNNVNSLEKGSGTVTTTFQGGNSYMELTARWWG